MYLTLIQKEVKNISETCCDACKDPSYTTFHKNSDRLVLMLMKLGDPAR